MTEMQAAVGIVQLGKLDRLISLNRARFNAIAEPLEGIVALRPEPIYSRVTI